MRDAAKEELKNALREIYYKDLELEQIKKEKDVQKKRFREVKREFLSTKTDLQAKIKELESALENNNYLTNIT